MEGADVSHDEVARLAKAARQLDVGVGAEPRLVRYIYLSTLSVNFPAHRFSRAFKHVCSAWFNITCIIPL